MIARFMFFYKPGVTVEGVATHHDREVGSHDVVVAAGSSDGDGVGAQPRLGV